MVRYRGRKIGRNNRNLVAQSENFGTTWVATGTPTRTPAAHTASGVSLDLVGDDNAAAAEYYNQTIAFVGDGVKALSIHMKKGASPDADGDQFRLLDETAVANRLLVTITWDGGGVPSLSVGVGTHIATIAMADGVYRFLFSTTSVTAANTNTIRVGAGRGPTGDVTDVGDVYMGGVQAENRAIPSRYVKRVA